MLEVAGPGFFGSWGYFPPRGGCGRRSRRRQEDLLDRFNEDDSWVIDRGRREAVGESDGPGDQHNIRKCFPCIHSRLA
jgi:hypothetical protein